MKLYYQPPIFKMITTFSLKKTTNSSYDLAKEDFIHETSLTTANIQDNENNFLKKTLNASYDLVEEDFIHKTP